MREARIFQDLLDTLKTEAGAGMEPCPEGLPRIDIQDHLVALDLIGLPGGFHNEALADTIHTKVAFPCLTPILILQGLHRPMTVNGPPEKVLQRALIAPKGPFQAIQTLGTLYIGHKY
jgi:hypothetical protein